MELKVHNEKEEDVVYITMEQTKDLETGEKAVRLFLLDGMGEEIPNGHIGHFRKDRNDKYFLYVFREFNHPAFMCDAGFLECVVESDPRSKL